MGARGIFFSSNSWYKIKLKTGINRASDKTEKLRLRVTTLKKNKKKPSLLCISFFRIDSP